MPYKLEVRQAPSYINNYTIQHISGSIPLSCPDFGLVGRGRQVTEIEDPTPACTKNLSQK